MGEPGTVYDIVGQALVIVLFWTVGRERGYKLLSYNESGSKDGTSYLCLENILSEMQIRVTSRNYEATIKRPLGTISDDQP